MQKLSVVMITRNGAQVIGETIKSFSGLTDDVLVYDNGSTDGTQKIVNNGGARLVEGNWEGFGKTKNKANALAKYDWILSLDADEAIDKDLEKELASLDLSDDTKVYELRFKNYIGNKWLRFGEWGDDKHIRLFNRRKVKWNDAEVHESLTLPAGTAVVPVKGYVLHKTAATFDEYRRKMITYSELNAEKYFKQGKRPNGLKAVSSAIFSFVKNYFFKLGFLDGTTGYHCAAINAKYTFLKYEKIKKFSHQSAPDNYRGSHSQSRKTS